MTKNEALQLFASHVDIPALKADFPDIDWVATELEDGQQEIIIRLQGEDADFRPFVDIAAIEEMDVCDLPGEVKTPLFLRKYKRRLIRQRKLRRDTALVKRVKSLVTPAGVSLKQIAGIICRNIPPDETEPVSEDQS